MPPRYLTSKFERDVLFAIERFDPDARLAFHNPLLIVDVRDDVVRFKEQLGLTLVSALSDKIKNLELNYVSRLGLHGKKYAMDRLRERHAELSASTRRTAKEALLNWRKARAKLPAFEDEFQFASGIGIVLPISGALLHYDAGLAVQID